MFSGHGIQKIRAKELRACGTVDLIVSLSRRNIAAVHLSAVDIQRTFLISCFVLNPKLE
jgi:hypothetical protein